MPYLSCSSTNQSYGERLSLKEHLISDCYPRMLSCVGNYIQTYDETTQRTSLVKFSTYLNLPLKLDIPVTCKQDWHIFPSSKFILRLPNLLDILSTFLRLLKYKETSIKFSLESKTSVLILRPKDFIPPRAEQETPTNLHKNLGTFIQTYDETNKGPCSFEINLVLI